LGILENGFLLQVGKHFYIFLVNFSVFYGYFWLVLYK